MAKYENECNYPCYSPCKELDFTRDNRLVGLWSLISSSIKFEAEDKGLTNCYPDIYNKLFSTDPISYRVLSAIVKKNVNADQILVRKLRNKFGQKQFTSDIQETLGKVTNPKLIAEAGSNFIVIIADASYGIDVWVWDLTSCSL